MVRLNPRHRKFTRVGHLGKSRWSKLDGRGKFNFVNKDDPSYQPNYGKCYTERQKQILAEELAVEDIPCHEITLLINKARSLSDIDGYEKAKELRDRKIHANEYTPDITAEEARAILNNLTPWKRGY